jgi:hypothetical protein
VVSLAKIRQLRFQEGHDIITAGLYLTSAQLDTAIGAEAHLQQALEWVAQLKELIATRSMMTQQFEMAAASQAAAAHLKLAETLENEGDKQSHQQAALAASAQALSIYDRFGFTQIIECVAEEIFFYHSQALAANGQAQAAGDYLRQAYEEMMRKYDLIPADLIYRQTFLQNVPLHRLIEQAYNSSTAEPTAVSA